jgi:hypothetical protein
VSQKTADNVSSALIQALDLHIIRGLVLGFQPVFILQNPITLGKEGSTSIPIGLSGNTSLKRLILQKECYTTCGFLQVLSKTRGSQ